MPPPEVSDRNPPVGEVSPGLRTHRSDLLSPPSTQSLPLYFGIAAAPRRPGAGTAEESRGKVAWGLGVQSTLCPPTSRGAVVAMVTRAAVTSPPRAGRSAGLGRPAAVRSHCRRRRARRRRLERGFQPRAAAGERVPTTASREESAGLFVGKAGGPGPVVPRARTACVSFRVCPGRGGSGGDGPQSGRWAAPRRARRGKPGCSPAHRGARPPGTTPPSCGCRRRREASRALLPSND